MSNGCRTIGTLRASELSFNYLYNFENFILTLNLSLFQQWATAIIPLNLRDNFYLRIWLNQSNAE